MDRQVRGTVINAYLGFVKKKWGIEGLEKCMKDLGIEESVKDGHYYIDQVRENILRWISREKGSEYLEEAGSFVVENLGILSWIVRFASPKTIVEKFPKSYSEVYTFGRIEIDHSDEKNIIARLYDVCQIEETCEVWKGVCKGVLKITKSKGTVTKTRCQLKGDAFCEYVVELE